MSDSQDVPRCRSCGSDRGDLIVDLGPQPDPDTLLDPVAGVDAPLAPVRAWICSSCELVQLAGSRPSGRRLAHGGHSSALSPTLMADPRVMSIIRLLPVDHRLVVEVEATDRGPGASSADRGVPVADVFPDPRGDHSEPWRTMPIPADASQTDQHPGRTAGLVQAGHALTHADDLDGLLRAIESVLAPGGLVAIDFHHSLGLAQGQFDVLSHAHRSYLSLSSLEGVLARHSLVVVAAELTPEFGGTVRLLAGRPPPGDSIGGSSPVVERIKQTEREARLHLATGYADLPAQIARASADLMGFLELARNEGRMVAGYGAAARGTVLLNLAGITPEQLRFVVDRSPDKQGRLLPGCRIPIHAPGEIARARPDDILILPWPLAPEIERQLAGARSWGARFLVAMPHFEFLE